MGAVSPQAKEHRMQYQKDYWDKPVNKTRHLANMRKYWNLPQNKARRNSRKAELAASLKIEVLSHYSSGEPHCAGCGEADIIVLTIDHVDGGGNKHRRALGWTGGGSNFYRWLRKNNYPKGYRVLCMNCQFRSKWALEHNSETFKNPPSDGSGK